MENGGLSSQIEGHEKLPVQNRVQAVIALGMGPVRPQLRGGVGKKERHVVAHHPRMREIAIQTLQNQERWIRGVREIPEYVLPEIAFVENDNRLMMVMESLRQLYGKEKLDALGLGDFDNMRIEDVRKILSSINRKLPPSEWGEQADIDVWKATIDQEDALTSQWLQGSSGLKIRI